MLILTRPLLAFHDDFARALPRKSSAIYRQHNRPSHRRVGGPGAETMLVGACLMTLGVGLLTIVHDTGDDAKALAFIAFAGFVFVLH